MTTFKPVDARGIANLFLAKGQAEGVPLDPMKILKLTYIAHGWVLALADHPLFSQEVLAWPYGPVVRDVYSAFRNFGSAPITSPASDFEDMKWKPVEAELDSETGEIVDEVWDEYKDFSGLQLSTLTHRPGSPWALVTCGRSPAQIRDIPIPNDVIRDHYLKLAQNRVSNG